MDVKYMMKCTATGKYISKGLKAPTQKLNATPPKMKYNHPRKVLPLIKQCTPASPRMMLIQKISVPLRGLPSSSDSAVSENSELS